MAPDAEKDSPIPLLGSIMRGLAGVGALLRAGGSAVSSTLRGPAARGTPDEKSGGDPAIALRAIAGGAALREPRRAEAVRSSAAKPQPEDLDAGQLFESGGALGDPIDETRIVLLPRDPRVVFAYWQLDAATSVLRDASPGREEQLCNDALWIEATDDTPDAVESWYLTLQPRASSCYVDLARPRRSVRVVLGLQAEGHDFRPLAASATVALPEHAGAASEPARWHHLGSAREGSIAPPGEPSAESGELLYRRALEHDAGSSAGGAWGSDDARPGGDERDVRRR